MTIPAAQDPSLGFVPGDHVCAFYSSSRNVLDDIVVDYITKGLQGGNKVFCMVDQPSAVQGRVPPQLVAREGMLNVLTEDEAYMPGGSFSKDVFIRNMETMARAASEEGYGSFRACGDESFLVRSRIRSSPTIRTSSSAFMTLTCSMATRSCMCSGRIRGFTLMALSSAIRTTRQNGFPDNRWRQRSTAGLARTA